MGQVARLKATRRRPTLKTRKHNYGAHDRSRTDDLTLTKGVLYQLSYMGRKSLRCPDNQRQHVETRSVRQSAALERVMGIEPTPSAWKAEVLPLNYTRGTSVVTAPPQRALITVIDDARHRLPDRSRLTITRLTLVEGGGFEPPKAEPSDLQSDPFDRSGTPPNRATQFRSTRRLSQQRFVSSGASR